MECMSCGAQWTVREGQTRLANCPFCGKLLLMERSTAIYTDFMEAMRAVVQMKGAGFLLNEPAKVMGIFLDITKGLQREYQLLKLFYNNETQKFFKDMQDMSEGQLRRASRSLQENMFMNPDSAKYIVDAFAILLGKKEAEELPGAMKRNLCSDSENMTGADVAEKGFLPLTGEALISGNELKAGEYIRLSGIDSAYKIEDITYNKPVLIKALNCITNKIEKKFVDSEKTFLYKDGIYCAYPDILSWGMPEWRLSSKGITKISGKTEWIHRNGLYLLSDLNSRKVIECSEDVIDQLTDMRRMQYLHKERGHYVFMDPGGHEKLEVREEDVDASMRFVKEKEMVMFDYHEDGTFSVETPTYVILEVISCGEKSGNKNGKIKTAVVETGETVQDELWLDEIQVHESICIQSKTGMIVDDNVSAWWYGAWLGVWRWPDTV